jgi:seryl-tRNA synthetase
MIDIKLIRETPELLDASLKARGLAPKSAEILELDQQIREIQTELQKLLARRNEIAKDIGKLKAKGEDASGLLKEAESIKTQTPELEAELTKAQAQMQSTLEAIPNILQIDVPFGKDESEALEIKSFLEPKTFAFTAKEHFELGEALGLMDFEQTAKFSGARFVTLKGELAKMERALAQFMLDHHTNEFGYTEVSTPFLVKHNAPYGVGQLPKFEEDLFKTTNDYYLISTSEVTLTNLVADSIVPEEQLPLRYTAHSHCFRSEAGSAGKDTRGMIRLHQFAKVELVSITTPEDSESEHERMLSAAESILQKLQLPYRVMVLCSGDTGFSSSKTYDLEVWLPGQNRYREISSCSNCTDFQARRMKARYKGTNDHKNHQLHTLNGSGLAIGRTIVAILENYQQEDGSIIIPDVLRPYMQGKTIINRSY